MTRRSKSEDIKELKNIRKTIFPKGWTSWRQRRLYLLCDFLCNNVMKQELWEFLMSRPKMSKSKFQKTLSKMEANPTSDFKAKWGNENDPAEKFEGYSCYRKRTGKGKGPVLARLKAIYKNIIPSNSKGFKWYVLAELVKFFQEFVLKEETFKLIKSNTKITSALEKEYQKHVSYQEGAGISDILDTVGDVAKAVAPAMAIAAMAA